MPVKIGYFTVSQLTYKLSYTCTMKLEVISDIDMGIGLGLFCNLAPKKGFTKKHYEKGKHTCQKIAQVSKKVNANTTLKLRKWCQWLQKFTHGLSRVRNLNLQLKWVNTI